jgi:hypothetical protein
MTECRHSFRYLFFILAATLGCGGEPAPSRAKVDPIAELHAALKAKNPNYDGQAQVLSNGSSITAVDLSDRDVPDISPLAGLPLETFYAENTKISDLTPLKGIRITVMSLSNTPVADLTPLVGMPLNELRLIHTQVRDLTPLRGAPLQQLWLNDTPVEDLSPLAGAPLVSLTIQGTKVRDISVVRRLPLLERLHLGETPVEDLSPVAGLPLTRLIFSPQTVTKGIDAARSLRNCREIGPSLEQMGPPQGFWTAYDAGAFSKP